MRNLRHPSFSVYQGERIDPDDHQARQRLAGYMVHPPIAVEHLRYRPETSRVIYYGRQDRRCKRSGYPPFFESLMGIHILSSGFHAAVATRIRAPLGNPSILSVDRGNSGELVLKVTPIARAKCYEVRSAAVGADNAPGSWASAGLFTNSRSMTVAALVPGTTYSFQVRAVGGSTRYKILDTHYSNLK